MKTKEVIQKLKGTISLKELKKTTEEHVDGFVAIFPIKQLTKEYTENPEEHLWGRFIMTAPHRATSDICSISWTEYTPIFIEEIEWMEIQHECQFKLRRPCVYDDFGYSIGVVEGTESHPRGVFESRVRASHLSAAYTNREGQL